MKRLGLNFRKHCIVFLLLLAVSLGASVASHAQQPPTPANSQPAPAAAPAPTPPQSGQVQGYTLSPAQEAQAIAYARAQHELYFLDVAYGLASAGLVAAASRGPDLSRFGGAGSGGNFVQTLVFAPLLLLTIDILSLPTAMWAHRLALKYQQSIQGWGSWLGDWAKGEVVAVTIGVLVIWILYAVIRKSPRRWWLYFWLVAMPLDYFGRRGRAAESSPVFTNSSRWRIRSRSLPSASRP